MFHIVESSLIINKTCYTTPFAPQYLTNNITHTCTHRFNGLQWVSQLPPWLRYRQVGLPSGTTVCIPPTNINCHMAKGFWCKVFTVQIPFLSPNQQHENTEGITLITFSTKNIALGAPAFYCIFFQLVTLSSSTLLEYY